MKPITSVIICGDINPDDLGGAEVHIVEVVKGLAGRGHTCHVFVGNDDRIKKIWNDQRIIVHKVNYPRIRNFASFSYVIHAKKAIAEFLVKNKVDILHAKQLFPYGIIGAFLKKKFALPLYITVQNPLGYKEELVIKSRFLPRIIKKYLQDALRPFVVYALHYADIVACVSRYSEGHSKRMGAKHTAIVPNGVNSKIFRPAGKLLELKKIFERDELWITTTSTLIPRNGVDTLVLAFGELALAIPKLRLKIAGEGPMQNELENLIKKIDIADKVDFLGTLRHQEIPNLLHKSVLFVRPSRFEGFGMSFIEAMACGVPIVACPVGGIVDFVSDGKTGLLVPPNDPKALAESIRKILSDHSLYERIRDEGLKMVRERYSWEAIVDEVEKLYFS